MADPEAPAVSPEDFAAADARYAPFPAFSQWTGKADEAQYDRQRNVLRERRQASTPGDWERAVEITRRAAAIDTGAIEGLYQVDRGFTYAVATQATAWELRIAEQGENVRALFEAQLEGFDLILDAATKRYPISEAFIRTLQAMITQPQPTHKVLTPQGWQEQALAHGEYKAQPNHPWRGGQIAHAYAPVAATSAEMHRLVSELLTEGFEEAHPVVQAAYVHYTLASIHPFADGNGRVARALASIHLLRADSIPLLIYADQTQTYIQALEAADDGDHQRFTSFVQDRAIGAMGRVIETLRVSGSPDPQAAKERLRLLVFTAPGVTFAELDATANSVMDLATRLLGEEITELELPSNVTSHVLRGSGDTSTPPAIADFRRPVSGAPNSTGFRLLTAAPANAAVDAHYDVLVSVGGHPAACLFRRIGFDEMLEISFAEMNPEPSEDVIFRLRMFLRADLYERLHALTELAESTFRASGYARPE